MLPFCDLQQLSVSCTEKVWDVVSKIGEEIKKVLHVLDKIVKRTKVNVSVFEIFLKTFSENV